MPWYVLYTKPKSEKKVADTLEKMGVEVYCPLRTEVRQWSDRKKKIRVPLFTSYVFVNLLEHERDQVFEVPGAVRYLFWLRKPAVVKDQEIKTIKKWLDEGNIEEISISHLSPGDKVVITSGNFKEQEAIIRHVDKKRVRLILPSMDCTVNVKVADISPV